MKHYLSLKKPILLFVFCLALLSCGGADTAEPGATGNLGGSGGKFEGIYNGSYEGTTTGSWTLDIDANGNVTGSVMTSTGTIVLAGVVNSNGKLTVSGDNGTKFSFILIIDSSGNVTGTWTDSIGGSGTVSKPQANGTVTATGNLKLVSSDFSFGTKTSTISVAEIINSSTSTSVSLKNTPASAGSIFDSMTMVVTYNVDGKLTLLSFEYFNTATPQNIFSYDLDCNVTNSECSKVKLDVAVKSITFSNSILTATPNSQGNVNLATKTLNVTGSSSWD